MDTLLPGGTSGSVIGEGFDDGFLPNCKQILNSNLQACGNVFSSLLG